MNKVNIKVLSVNAAWQGKRYKTKAYKKYERDLLFILPNIIIPSSPFKLSFEIGFSNKLSDLSNPLKLIEDIIQKKYGINDRDVYEISMKKVIVKKSQEYFKFNLESMK